MGILGIFGQVVATALCSHGIIRDVVQTNHDPDLLEKLYILFFLNYYSVEGTFPLFCTSRILLQPIS